MLHAWSTSTNTLSVVALLQKTVDTTNGKLEASLRGSGDGLSISTSLATSGRLSGFSCTRNLVRHESTRRVRCVRDTFSALCEPNEIERQYAWQTIIARTIALSEGFRGVKARVDGGGVEERWNASGTSVVACL